MIGAAVTNATTAQTLVATLHAPSAGGPLPMSVPSFDAGAGRVQRRDENDGDDRGRRPTPTPLLLRNHQPQQPLHLAVVPRWVRRVQLAQQEAEQAVHRLEEDRRRLEPLPQVGARRHKLLPLNERRGVRGRRDGRVVDADAPHCDGRAPLGPAATLPLAQTYEEGRGRALHDNVCVELL